MGYWTEEKYLSSMEKLLIVHLIIQQNNDRYLTLEASQDHQK